MHEELICGSVVVRRVESCFCYLWEICSSVSMLSKRFMVSSEYKIRQWFTVTWGREKTSKGRVKFCHQLISLCSVLLT